MHDAHVFMQVTHRGGELVGVATGEVGGESLAVAPHEVEEGAACIELGEAEGCEGCVVDSDQGQDVPVAKAAPETHFVFEFGLELVVFRIVLVGDLTPNDFDSSENPLVAFNGVCFPYQTEPAEAYLST